MRKCQYEQEVRKCLDEQMGKRQYMSRR
jgi:hypothetical protein